MSSHPLRNEPNIPSRIKPQIKSIEQLPARKDRITNQLRKKGVAKALQKLDLFDPANPREFPREMSLLIFPGEMNHFLSYLEKLPRVRKLKMYLQRLKCLKSLDINLIWLLCFSSQQMYEFLECLNHFKGLSEVCFCLEKLNDNFDAKILVFSNVFRRLRFLPHLKIRLSVSLRDEPQPYHLRLLRCFCQHEGVTEIDLGFFLADPQRTEELFAILKDSKSLKRLSLRPSFYEATATDISILQDTLSKLTEIKPLKDLKVVFRGGHMDFLTRNLKVLVPVFQKLAQSMNVEIILNSDCFIVNPFSRLSNWRFERSMWNLDPLCTFRRKIILDKTYEGWKIIKPILFLLFLFIFLVSSRIGMNYLAKALKVS